MKKILAILMTICMLAGVISLPVIAEEPTDTTDPADTKEPAADVVLRLSALKRNGDTDVIQDFTNFEDGWNASMKYAVSDAMENYERVVVDFFSDWTADDDGAFTDD